MLQLGVVRRTAEAMLPEVGVSAENMLTQLEVVVAVCLLGISNIEKSEVRN